MRRKRGNSVEELRLSKCYDTRARKAKPLSTLILSIDVVYLSLLVYCTLELIIKQEKYRANVCCHENLNIEYPNINIRRMKLPRLEQRLQTINSRLSYPPTHAKQVLSASEYLRFI